MLEVGSPSLPQQVESSALGAQISSPGLDGVLLLLSLPHLFPERLRGVQNSPAGFGGAPSCLPASWEEEVNGETLVSRGHIGDGPRSLREDVSSDQGS